MWKQRVVQTKYLQSAQPPVNTRCKATPLHFVVMCYVALLAKKAGITANCWSSFSRTYKGKCNTSSSFHGTVTEAGSLLLRLTLPRLPLFFNSHNVENINYHKHNQSHSNEVNSLPSDYPRRLVGLYKGNACPN